MNMLLLTLRHILDSIFLYIRANLPFLWHPIDTLTLTLACLSRFGCGIFAAAGADQSRRPEKLLELYQYEGCPFCLKVRETLTVLNLDHIVYPCPRETLKANEVCLNSRYRQTAKNLGGSMMFPFLIDPNTNTKMYHSDDIIAYLWKTYGDKARKPFAYRLAFFKPIMGLSLSLWTFCRPCLDMGVFRAASRNPEKLIELWGFTNSAPVKRVTEALSTLEIAYVFHVMPQGATEKRKAFRKAHWDELSAGRKRLGLCKVPYLEDPNTGAKLFESTKIVEYLKKRYQTAPVPAETWLDYRRGA